MILIAGDDYYEELRKTNPNELLESSEVNGMVPCFNQFEIKVEPADENQVIRGLFVKIPGTQVLEESIQEFIDKNIEYAIFTGNGFSVALINQDNRVYIFDSHSRGPKGHTAGEGSACCISFENNNAAKQIKTLFQSTIVPKKPFSHGMSELEKSNYQYSIRPIQCTLQVPVNEQGNQSTPNDQEQENVPLEYYSTQDSINIQNDIEEPIYVQMEIGPNRASLDCVIRADQPVEPELGEYIRELNLSRQRGQPMYPNLDKRLEELSFVQLFPHGINGYSEERITPITPLDYFQQRLMCSNNLFHNNEYLFYALNRVEQYTVQQKIAVCGNMTTETSNEGENYVQGLENAHLYMSAIRGSSSYWRRYTRDCLAMIEQLGTPTFFLTISYDDLNSFDSLTAMWKAQYGADTELPKTPQEIPFNQRRDLLNANPIASARHFSHKMNIILDILKKYSPYLFGAQLENFTYRIEFQGRGSPHVHMLLWLADVPKWNSPEGIHFINTNVSCSLDVPFKELVLRYQNHHHTRTCFKQNNSTCRFSFPRIPCAGTTILDDEEISKNFGRFINLKRSKDEIMINNYHPKLLQILKCNMDIQPVTGSRAIAYYIGKYMSKSEPDHLREDIRKLFQKFKNDSSLTYQQKALQIANKLISQREISAPEAAFRLCHLPLKKSSRVAIFVPAFVPHRRIRMARTESIGQQSPDFYLNIFDRYINRPNNPDFENLSCIEFAAHYSPAPGKQRKQLDLDLNENAADEEEEEAENASKYIQLLNGKGKIYRRKHAAIINHPFFNPMQERNDYLYSLILLYYPFRDEETILHPTNEDGSQFERSILEAFDELKPFFRTFENDPIIRLDLLEKINDILFLLADQTSDNSQHNADDDNFDYNYFFEENPDPINENEIFPPDIETADTLRERVSRLNQEQRLLYEKIVNQITNGNKEQILELVLGSGGVGKSFLIQTLTMVIHTLCNGGPRSLLKMGPTGVSALQIGGTTIHRALSMGVERDGVAKYIQLGGQKLQMRRDMYKDLQFIIIDEISMVSYDFFRQINLRLQEIANTDKLFGGMNVLLFGDLLQIAPVRGSWIFEQTAVYSAEINLWTLFNFNELTVPMRQNPDDPLYNILEKLRYGILLPADIIKLRERVLNPIKDNYQEMAIASYSSLHLYPKIKQVESYNEDRMLALACDGVTIYNCTAHDTYAAGQRFGHVVPDKVIPKDDRKCGGMPKSLDLAISCRVMLKYNADVAGGLCNGSIGEVKGFVWRGLRLNQREPGNLPESVLVKFDNKIDPRLFSTLLGFRDCVPVSPKAFDFVGNRGARVARLQVPLATCFATTIHKSQSLSLSHVTVYLGSHLFLQNMAYVSLSRAKTFYGLYILEIDPKRLLVSKKGTGPCADKPLSEYFRLKIRKIGVENQVLLSSLLKFVLEYIMCPACKDWICICDCLNA